MGGGSSRCCRSGSGVRVITDEPGPASPGRRAGNFTLIDKVGGYNLQLHVCPTSPDHPHIELLQ
ncbi:hypothetical protein GCM10010266_73850 [Streptomyces griseomycini]|nr:hypothetical protein GCM10010266_73850 [Streptomyces griseomycini]GGR62085.1 hypothetical protein GCM10015536_77340 [Streptomyces griseomycini]